MARRAKGSGSVTSVRPGVYRLRVYLGPHPVTGTPRQASKTVQARNLREATEALKAFEAELGTSTSATDATVRQIVADYLSHIAARGRAPKTLHENRATADRYILPALGDLRVADLTPAHIDQLYDGLLTGTGDRRPLSPATVRRVHAVLAAALNLAVRHRRLSSSPATEVDPPDLGHPTLRIPTHDEVRRLLAASGRQSEGLGMLLTLAVLTGARRGELCALRWPDVDEGVVRIRRSLYRAGSDRGEKGTKGGRERWVAVAPAGAALLERWRARCHQVATDAGVELVPDAFVVSPMPDGSRPTNPDTVSSAVHRLCADLEMSHVHLHSLRHYAATELLAAGIDPRNTAEVLGHADGGALALRTYAHGTAERQRRAAEALGALVPAELSDQTPTGSDSMLDA